MQQQHALDILKLGENVFLTGAAGAGKTFVLGQYIKYLRDNDVVVAVTASTGIAATHINGQTIHSWCGMGIKDSLTDDDLHKIKSNERVKRNLRHTKVLIIDEVSMLHARQLDNLNQILKYCLQTEIPFAGLQVILCGDFFQLPPVEKSAGDKLFAFESRSWDEANFKICYLHEQHRQKNDLLLQVLNDIRSGNAGEQTKVPLRTRYKKEPESSTDSPAVPTILYTRNISVDEINQRELDKLSGKERVFKMETTGFDKIVEGLKKNCLAPENLKLKIGSQVMFVKNSPFGDYVNGTRAVVEKFSESEGVDYPVVRTLSGDRINALPQEWVYEDRGTIRAKITQIPLRLAWAITVHKSQGMTLDAAEMDLSDAFEPGMGYVALSRVRSLRGLKLMGLNEMALKVHPLVSRQDELFKELTEKAQNEILSYSEIDLLRQQADVLLNRFEGNNSETKLKKSFKKKEKKKKGESTFDTTASMLAAGLKLEEISEQRGLKIGTLLDHIDKLKGQGKLPDISYIKNDIPPEVFRLISEKFKKSKDGRLTPIFESLEGRYTFDYLKLIKTLM